MGTVDLAIRTRGLRKLFGSQVAVEGLSLEVPRGEIFGFLGPNGAGKSTSIKMLLGLVTPTSGEAQVLGRSTRNAEARRKIGFLPEHFQFYSWLTARELLRVHGRLYGMPRASVEGRAWALLELVGLGAHADKRLREFSKGMLQRIGLAQALLNEPELIFLDEPTSGLDPLGRRLVRDIIKAQRERGATVFLNSHLLSEVEITCDRVAFIKDGRVLETRQLGGPSDGATSVIVRARKLSPDIASGLSRWGSSIRIDGEQLSFAIASTDLLPDLLRYLVAQGVDVYELRPQQLSLEERFVQVVGEDRGL